MKTATTGLMIAFALALAGCPASRDLETVPSGGGNADTGTPAPDAGPQLDGGADAGGVSLIHVWKSALEKEPGQYEVALAGMVTGDVLTLRVRTGLLPEVYGLYFRLSYDPGVVRFESMAPGAAFPDGSLSKAVERGGLLIAGITNKGGMAPLTIDLARDIAVLKFRIVGTFSTDVAFVAGECSATDKYLRPVSRDWFGGRLEYR